MRPDEPAPTREVPSAPPPAATRELGVPPVTTREVPQSERTLPPRQDVAATREFAPRAMPAAPATPMSTRTSTSPSAVPPTLRDLRRASPDPFTPVAQDPISKLLRAVKEVVLEGVTIVQHPRDFPARLDLNDHNLLVHGTRFLLGTVPATFVLLLPVHVIHGRPISQTAVGFLFAGIAFFTGALMHLMLRIVRARPTPMGAAIGLYSYIVGFQGIVFIILSYPIGFKFGSKLYFGSTQEETQAIISTMNNNDAVFFLINSLFAYVVLSVITFGGFLPMIARYFELRRPAKTRAALVLLIPLMVTGMLLQYFLPQIKRAAESL